MGSHRLYVATTLLALSSASLWAEVPANAVVKGAEVLKAERMDVSRPLRELGSARRGIGPAPVRPLPLPAGPPQDDPAMQTSFLGPLATVPGLNVAGIGDGEQGYVPNSTPPNPSLAVGTTQVVQVAGDALAVFDKAGGAIVPGFPKTGNALWAGFGGACENAADGMVTVRFDRAASRWVVVLTAGTPVVQCVAVSTTADATGPYARYAFGQGGSVLADGSKLGLWPDGYYLAANRYDSEQAFAGARVCVLERAAMLHAAAARQQCFQLPAAAGGGLLPADLDGALAPAAGAPNPLVGLAANALQIWKFHVDWAQPAGSTLSGPVSLPVAAFTPACDGGHCIPQPRTSQKLDARSDRLMARAAYRVFADGHDALVLTHAVKTGRRPRLAGSGQRWYELRNLLQAPLLFQQGTFSPDRRFRWMGSIAMDRVGNIALGYSVASSTLFPGLRITGRQVADAAGQMQNEAVLQAGAGSQLPGSSHWGEQSAMVLDPADDCGFWTTNTYLKASSASAWSTRIASFRFGNCGP